MVQSPPLGTHLNPYSSLPMNHSNTPIIQTLRKAGRVHSRRRAAVFLLRALLFVIIAIPLLMLADVLFHFSSHLRLAGSIAIIVALLAAFGISLFIAIFSRPPLLRIARLLESRNPQLGSKLVNILQLENDSHLETASPLTRSLAAQAVSEAEKSIDLPKLPALAHEPRLPRIALRTAAAPLLILVLTVLGGHHARQEWLRFMDPFGDHPPFSLTHLEITSPTKNTEILYGGSVKIEVKATGHQPRELFITATDDTSAPRTLPMVSRGDGTFIASLEGITRPLKVTAHTADHSSRSHRLPIRLILTPQIGTTTVSITPPPYTGQNSRLTAYRYTALQALEGTEISFVINSNRPLGEGSLKIDSGTAEPLTIPLKPAKDGPENSATVTFPATASGRLFFHLVDAVGNAATEIPTSSITVTKDLPPAILITAPDTDSLVVLDYTVPVLIDASDDYGITQIRLHVGINDQFIPIEPVVFDSPGERRHRLTHPLDLAKLGAKPGDSITLFAEAIDSKPEPQITRTTTRRLQVITEDEYNEHLRREADVAAIAGKYEDLLNRLEKRIAEQERIAEKLAELKKKAAENPQDPENLNEFAKALSEQMDLNQDLAESAEEMENFGRENPVYDFEKELHERLKEQAAEIRESVAQNQKEIEEAIEKGPEPPQPPSEDMIAELGKAAEKQQKNLNGSNEESREEIIEPLEDLAQLHELMKSFGRFQDLAEEQKELARQSKAYEQKQELNAEDRLALRELGAAQRELSGKLKELEEKLRADAEKAIEKFPEAAASASRLAEAIELGNMPGTARDAASDMLLGKAQEGHSQAQNLSDEMEKLFEDAEQGQQQAGEGVDRALKLQRGMNPGDSIRQMLLSKNFRPLPGQEGQGAGGSMSSAMMNGSQLLLGGESLMEGFNQRNMPGKGDSAGPGMSGSPTAKIDPATPPENNLESARRTTTPGSSTSLLQYEKIADAYFRRLTTKP